MNLDRIRYDHHCFVCGEKNPQGLKLKFFIEGEKMCTEFTPSFIYQGWPGLLHGGITCTIFDEVMSQCVQVRGLNGLTARLEVRYRERIPLGKTVRFEAWIIKKRGPLFEIAGQALLENGSIAAEAKSRFMTVGREIMFNREEAHRLLLQHVNNKNLLKHTYAVEAVMRTLARHFGEDEELWGLAGLLHDIDYEETKDDPHRHSLIGGQILEEAGYPPEIVYAVKVHNDAHGLERKSRLDKALYATDPLTGLIVAGALIRPEKRLDALDVASLIKRFGEKSFARGARRETIASCVDLGLSLEEFIGLGLEAMQKIHEELGL